MSSKSSIDCTQTRLSFAESSKLSDSDDNLIKLARALEKVAEFLPSQTIAHFDFKNVVVSFDIAHIGASNLDRLFDEMASSFWYERDVQQLFVETKGSFTNLSNAEPGLPTMPKNLSGSIEEAAGACHRMAQLIIQKAPEVMDRNIIWVWEKLVAQFPDVFPKLETPQDMRQWLNDEKNRDKMHGVRHLDLTRSEIEILPPEIHKIPNLEKVYLYDSKITGFPEVLLTHPKLSSDEIHMEKLKFLEGPYLLG
ncbi:MAG: leucine-rich repeat domain-containing protein [Chlamydiota bacterium]|jgi:hypothetical protein